MDIETTHFKQTGKPVHTILLVDDSPINLGVVVGSLESQGYEVLIAQDGEEALQRALATLPDLILLDVMMPGMDGFEVCRRLKADELTQNIPVIFMTSRAETEDKVIGFAMGAVDYLTKPLKLDEVRARIRTQLALHELRTQLAEKVVEQQILLDRKELEQQIASEYMNKLVGLDCITDRAAQFYMKPAESFSGDLIAIARTPDDRLHLMLADSTGHGLSAALAGMPVVEPFYAMSSKGFPISAIVSEVNRKLWNVLPVSHFVAAIFVSIDAVEQMVEVWCGGTPPPYALSADGEVAHCFKSRHLALGIMPPEQFDDSVEHFSFDGAGYSLLMFSDGVLDAEGVSGESFGEQRLLNAAKNSESGNRWQSIVGAIEAHCGGNIPGHDDVAMIMAQCECREEAGVEKTARQKQIPVISRRSVPWRFELTLTMHQLKNLDVVPLLLGLVQQIELDNGRGGEIFLILSELFNNALDHGVLKLNSSLKDGDAGMEQYYDERTARLAIMQEGEVQMLLEKVKDTTGSIFLRIKMKDSGDGFNHRALMSHEFHCVRRYGRGIPLLYEMCHSLKYFGNGSEVEAWVKLQNNEGVPS